MTLEEQIAALQDENTAELQSHIYAGVTEIARLNALLAAAVDGNAKVIVALNAAVQLVESLIIFMPDGMVLPSDLWERKTALVEALEALGVRK